MRAGRLSALRRGLTTAVLLLTSPAAGSGSGGIWKSAKGLILEICESVHKQHPPPPITHTPTPFTLRLTLTSCMEVDFCKPFCLQHEKHPKGARVGFKLRAFRQDFYLHLTPDSTFLATGGRSAASRASSGLRECFYSRDVNADLDSFVAVSLCEGLRGGFTYKGMEYIITASTEDTAAEYGHILEKTHRISRRMSSRHPGANFPSRYAENPPSNTVCDQLRRLSVPNCLLL
uniref:Uncharacterized protein n=1 Tax=Xiphophorus couchianus TaxID=32473 RepID=A0A3B5L3E0_9TELE